MKLGISDKGLKRLAQDQSKADLLRLIESGDLSDWYVHAANQPLDERNTGYITLFVEGDKYTDVSHYGEFFNFVKPSKSVYIEDIADEVIQTLKTDYETGYLSGDLEGWLDSADDWTSDIRELLNPGDIIDSAGWWDNPDFTSWFSERFDYNFILTSDGAVLFDLDELQGELVTLSKAELDAIWDI